MADKPLVRPLEWRDLPLLHKIKNHGRCFHSRVAFTRGPHPLQSALLESITPGRSDFTLLAPHARKRLLTAIGQVAMKGPGHIARLTFLAPEAALTMDNGLRLLESLAASAGGRGALGLIAEVDESSPAFETLRKAGFAIYARQRIWRWDPDDWSPSAPAADDPWRPLQQDDALAMKSLYHNLVPPLVKQVEEDPGPYTEGQALCRDGELLGFLTVETGPLGAWLEAYFHPAAEDFGQLIHTALNRIGATRSPVHVRVRSYQGWMNNPLDNLGLTRVNDQAVMVKRLAARVRQEDEQLMPVLDTTRPEPTAPFAPLVDKTPPRAESANQES